MVGGADKTETESVIALGNLLDAWPGEVPQSHQGHDQVGQEQESDDN
jgi:hypothetical protein